jgi:hypothetical protein
MSNFNFKGILKENLYIHNYPHDDKVKIVLNEGQVLMLEKEIHEGIMDLLKGYTKKQPGYKKAMENEIDKYLAKSVLDDKSKQELKLYYMKNFDKLPPEPIDSEDAADIEDSLEAAVRGDVDTVKDEMEAVDDIGDPDETPTEEVPKPDVDLEMQKEMDRAKQAEPAISAELLDITDATSEKWGKIRNKTQNKNLQKAMDYIYNLSLAEQRYLQLLQRLKINENKK